MKTIYTSTGKAHDTVGYLNLKFSMQPASLSRDINHIYTNTKYYTHRKRQIFIIYIVNMNDNDTIKIEINSL